MSDRSVRSARKRAFIRQQGHCWYCDFPMWTGDPGPFARRHGLSERAARQFQCTAEHLRARVDGGTDDPANIVAVCALCNRRRHARKYLLAPEQFRRHVRKGLARGGWHLPSPPTLLPSPRHPE